MRRQHTLPDPVPMRRSRRWLVYALAGGLAFGHAYDVFTRGDHWPISSYPMYAYLNPSDFRLTRLFAVTDEIPPREILIDAAWLRSTFIRILRRPDAQARLRQAVAEHAQAYGWDWYKKPGTSLVAYRLYSQHWTLRADADPDRAPDKAELLVEVRRDALAPTIAPTTTTAPATHTAPTTATTGEAARDISR